MYLSGSQNIMKSMNGLLKIRASEIEAENAYITNINDVQTINGKIGEDIVIDADTGKVIQFKDDVIMDGSLNIAGNTVTKNITTVGNNDITGTIFIRDPSDPNNVYMRVYYEPSLFGFVFSQEIGNRIMNFRVKDGAGNYKLFYFAPSQLYAQMPAYFEDWMNIASNRTLSFGDANPSLFVGAGIKFVPSAGSGIGDGWKFYCKGFNNNLGYQTLFTHNDLTNTERMTLQMNWSDIRSKVKHSFEADASFNTNISLNGNLIGNGNIHCNTFDVSNNSIFNGVSTYNANIFANNNLHCNTFDVSGNAIFKGTASFAGSVGALSCTTLTATGLISTSGNLLVSGTGSNLIFGTTTINANLTTSGLTCSSLTNNGVGTFANIINQTSTTASNNKITQTRILDDITGQPNIFKYSEFNYRTTGGAGTPSPCIVCREETSFNSMYFFPKLNQGNYNSMVQTNDRGIFAFYPLDNNAITMTAWGTIRAGVRVSCSSATSGKVEIGAGNYTLYLDNSLGAITHGGSYATAIPNFKILNGGQTRGLNFVAFSDASGSSLVNPLVSSSDSVITTDTQNNSVITISPRSTVTNGIRMTNTSATNANNDIRCGTSRIHFSHSSVISTIDISSNIVNIPATDAIALTSAENVFTTSGTLNSQKYRANAHLFSMANGSQSGCSVTIGGPVYLNRSDSSFNQITTNEHLIISAGSVNGGSNYFISGNSTTSNQYYQADNHQFLNRTADPSLNCAIQLRGNLNLFGSGVINFTDGTSINTASKLNAIGSIVSSTLNATATLTSNTIFNCGSISLSAGTWSVSVNCCVSVITGVTSVGEMLAGYSTSATALSQSTNLAIINAGNFNYNIGNQWVLTSTNTIVVSSTTTYYMITRCLFGSINRFQYGNGNSAFQATRIA